MVIKDGKKIEINIGGISKSQLEKILADQNSTIIQALSNKLDAMPVANASVTTVAQSTKEDVEIRSNSLDRIAEAMTTSRDSNKSNIDSKKENIKITKKDVSKSIDLLKDID